MGRHEITLIAGISAAFVGFFVFTKYLLGAELPVGFRMKPVPIFCGPADKLRNKLLKSQSKPVFSGTALGGTFLIFQKSPPSREFVLTFWRLGDGCIIATGTDAKIHESVKWVTQEEDGEKRN